MLVVTTNFTNECNECWNVTHGRVLLSSHKIQQLKRHKALLRKLSNRSIPIKQRNIAIHSGSGFASLLPLLRGLIVAGISRLIKRKLLQKYTNNILKHEEKYQQIHLQNYLLMWNFNCYKQNNNFRPRVREPEQIKEISMDSTIQHMEEPQRSRLKRTLYHMSQVRRKH